MSTGMRPWPHVQREDYPNVKYWTRATWKEAYKMLMKEPTNSYGADETEVSTKLLFLEDSNGTLLSKERIDLIRTAARGWFMWLREKKKAPKTWDTGIDHQSRTEVLTKLITEFPELGYGHHGWKADEVAIVTYSSWYKNHCTEPDAEETHVSKRNHAHAHANVRAPKRRRTENANDGAEISHDDAIGSTSGLSFAAAGVANDPTTRLDSSGTSLAMRPDEAPPDSAPAMVSSSLSSADDPSGVSGSYSGNSGAVSGSGSGSDSGLVSGSLSGCASASGSASCPVPRPISASGIKLDAEPASGKASASDSATHPFAGVISSSIIFAQALLQPTSCPTPAYIDAGQNTPPGDVRVAAQSLASQKTAPGVAVENTESIRNPKTKNTTRKSRILVPGKVHTARNICARGYKEKYPQATAAEFKEYWEKLPKGELETFKCEAKRLTDTDKNKD
ncbi:hypothetical protein OBBRIDRAFT_884401 [Obba rivulosa]|uniref:Uncharacterized protein n=1 Tax=Obba rivulosa TaxID=1052685 RepID=A0A8E2DSF6_9APHY|nr:hypothetical protein OBBRIDRAFT_884401 [Obba rivulosa]